MFIEYGDAYLSAEYAYHRPMWFARAADYLGSGRFQVAAMMAWAAEGTVFRLSAEDIFAGSGAEGGGHRGRSEGRNSSKKGEGTKDARDVP